MDRRPVYLDEVITEIRRLGIRWAAVAASMGGDAELEREAQVLSRLAILLEDFDPMERPWYAR